MSITLLLSGGLGNQLFQYSAARALSIKLGVDLQIDLRFYTNVLDPSRGPWITRLPIKAQVKSYRNHTQAHGLLARLQNQVFEKTRVFRSDLGYDPMFEHLSDGAVLSGLFQSPRFFDAFYPEIVDEINISKSSLLHNVSLVGELGLRNLVGIHVRRGDYLTHQSFAMQDSGLYYSRIMAEIDASGDKAIIFSDDINWCNDQIYFSGAEFFPYRPGLPPYVDLFAMSECKGLYIANSTFSWWAGWFAHHRGAAVIAPTNWILGKRAIDIDLYPQAWRTLD